MMKAAVKRKRLPWKTISATKAEKTSFREQKHLIVRGLHTTNEKSHHDTTEQEKGDTSAIERYWLDEK